MKNVKSFLQPKNDIKLMSLYQTHTHIHTYARAPNTSLKT